ncbi:MAG: hypothetical protein IT290_00695 [Deltaproteobacteria bacterium]|nr:hypothetical protein [Deltaproteobacteria bacterium]
MSNFDDRQKRGEQLSLNDTARDFGSSLRDALVRVLSHENERRSSSGGFCKLPDLINPSMGDRGELRTAAAGAEEGRALPERFPGRSIEGDRQTLAYPSDNGGTRPISGKPTFGADPSEHIRTAAMGREEGRSGPSPDPRDSNITLVNPSDNGGTFPISRVPRSTSEDRFPSGSHSNPLDAAVTLRFPSDNGGTMPIGTTPPFARDNSPRSMDLEKLNRVLHAILETSRKNGAE